MSITDKIKSLAKDYLKPFGLGATTPYALPTHGRIVMDQHLALLNRDLKEHWVHSPFGGHSNYPESNRYLLMYLAGVATGAAVTGTMLAYTIIRTCHTNDPKYALTAIGGILFGNAISVIYEATRKSNVPKNASSKIKDSSTTINE
jgi:hypothetical protein